MNIYAVCGTAVLACAASVIIKKLNGSGDAIPVVFIVAVSAALTAAAVPVIDFVRSLDASQEYEKYFSIMLKGLGIGFLGNTAAVLCRDSGENGMATTVDTATKVSIVVLCLPVISEVIGIAKTFLTS